MEDSKEHSQNMMPTKALGGKKKGQCTNNKTTLQVINDSITRILAFKILSLCSGQTTRKKVKQ